MPPNLGVALLVPAEIGGEVVEGAHGPADVGQRQAGEHPAVLDVLGRERHRHRQHVDRTPALPAVTQNEVPPRIELIFGLEIGM